MAVGDASCILQIEGTELRLVNQGSGAVEAIQLTPELFTQVVFGYRSVAWAVRQSGQFVNSELLALLNVLFPLGHTWIPASDWF